MIIILHINNYVLSVAKKVHGRLHGSTLYMLKSDFVDKVFKFLIRSPQEMGDLYVFDVFEGAAQNLAWKFTRTDLPGSFYNCTCIHSYFCCKN